MHTAATRKTFNAPAHQVWAAFDDFGGVHKFHPLIESSPTLSDKTGGVGCERQCHMYGGGSLKERITRYEPGTSMTIEIFDPGPFPLKQAVAEIRVTALDARRSEVTFVMHFEPKYGVVGWVMAKAMMARQFEKILDQILAGLSTHLETGKHIGRKGVVIDASLA